MRRLWQLREAQHFLTEIPVWVQIFILADSEVKLVSQDMTSQAEWPGWLD